MTDLNDPQGAKKVGAQGDLNHPRKTILERFAISPPY